jgi:replicative DNA helicase
MAEKTNKFKSIQGGLMPHKFDGDLDQLLTGRIQPQAVILEEAVLGAIMIDKDAFSSVVEVLKPDTFYLDKHKIIYDCMSDLFGKMQPIDLLTVHESLKKRGELDLIGGLDYLIELSNKVSSSANLEFHARIISQKYIQRELIRVSTGVIRDAFEDNKDVLEILDDAEKGLYNISDQNLNTGYKSISSLLVEAKKDIENASQNTGGLTGVTTGFRELDKITNGWQRSDLIIIAARPAMGKTAFVLSLAKNAAENGTGVGIFSLEMSSVQLVTRFISMDAGISSEKLRNGQMSSDEWTKLHNSVDRMSATPVYIDDTPAINIYELRAKCRRLKQNHDIGLIVIDYLQLMTGAPNEKRGNRQEEISAISRALKGIAKELNVPVLALSQLSRAVETRGGEKRPQLSDLRESGAIEQDADIVSFIYRPDYYGVEEAGFDEPKNLTEIIVAKHRNGQLGTVKLKFVAENVRFVDYEDDNFINDFGMASAMNFDDGNLPSNIMVRPSKINTGEVDGGNREEQAFDLF